MKVSHLSWQGHQSKMISNKSHLYEDYNLRGWTETTKAAYFPMVKFIDANYNYYGIYGANRTI